MHLSRSTWRRLLVVLVASGGFVLVFGGVVRDSAEERAELERGMPTSGSRLDFEASAYCKGEITATGTRVGRRVTGIAAADPDLLPLGSVVSITSSLPDYDGIYTVLDTGPLIQGRIVDLYMWSCFEALDFGRRPVELRILRYGWDPTNTDPSMIDQAFSEGEASARRRGADQPLPRPDTNTAATRCIHP
jgi:3D (Asp-Asp-Asp) domain-containing protein